MPERTSYDPGTPSWADLATSDPSGAKAFYRGLFGWESRDQETGGYAYFLLGGRRVAGVTPLVTPGRPTAWSTYVSTGDVEALSERAREAGATIAAGPMRVSEAGRMAFYAHPACGLLGAWEPDEHLGAEVTGDPGSMAWNELHTRDVAGAKAFGEAVLGWRMEDVEMEGMAYTVARLGEAGIAGIMEMPPGVPDEVPAYWVVYFEVADCDAAVERVKELGGTVDAGPFDMQEVGRFAFVSDPQGGQFAMIASVQPA